MVSAVKGDTMKSNYIYSVGMPWRDKEELSGDIALKLRPEE